MNLQTIKVTLLDTGKDEFLTGGARLTTDHPVRASIIFHDLASMRWKEYGARIYLKLFPERNERPVKAAHSFNG